jgi:hypothetical protein
MTLGITAFTFSGKCYKTFYGRKLTFHNKLERLSLASLYQPSLMFVGKAGAYPRVEHLKVTRKH